ncbi:peptidoglycan DD-metalloendopeptidase family protein [Reyranella sp.]|uniref:peptidoglycan DD-metalloendopeptidase family protein n=1 Tax=Reyranella sp. TaxID=1929291 RepID=UPI002F9233B5
MTVSSHPLGRPDRHRVAIAPLPWPVHCLLLIMAAVCAVLALRQRPPAVVIELSLAERMQAVPEIEWYEPPPPPTTAEFQPVLAEAEQDAPAALFDQPYEMIVRLERGETLDGVLADIGVVDADRAAIVDALDALLKKRSLAAGETLRLSLQLPADAGDAPLVLELQVRPQAEREYIVTRQEDGSYGGEAKVYKVRPRIVRIATHRIGSLLASGVKAGAPAAALREFIKALSYGVDFQRELRHDASFALLLEEGVTDDGHVARAGHLLAGQLDLAKRTATVIAFKPEHGARQFYTPDGDSVVRAFLRTPMDASRISSPFGMRRHPILGYSRMHEGVDFAAPKGTPILAAGRGTVVRAGYYGGYGLYVELRHTATVATAYGHMSRLARGIRPGVRVKQGQVIGFVGATGLATGPHLHYEFHRRGRPVNPLTQRASIRRHLTGRDMSRFSALVRQYREQLRTAPLIGTALH